MDSLVTTPDGAELFVPVMGLQAAAPDVMREMVSRGPQTPERFFALLHEFLIGDWPATCTSSL
jgi:hypothetical protein